MRAENQRRVAPIELDPLQQSWPLSGAAARALPPRERKPRNRDERHLGSGGRFAPIQLTQQATFSNWVRDVLDDAARHADGLGFLVVVIAVLFALSSMMYACATIPGSLL